MVHTWPELNTNLSWSLVKCSHENDGADRYCYSKRFIGCTVFNCFEMLTDVIVIVSLPQKVLFALCALNALTTTVCLVAAALRYLQIFAARRSCIVSS